MRIHTRDGGIPIRLIDPAGFVSALTEKLDAFQAQPSAPRVGPPAPDESSELAVSMEEAERWTETGGFRHAGATVEQLKQIVLDPSASRGERLGAAVAISPFSEVHSQVQGRLREEQSELPEAVEEALSGRLSAAKVAKAIG